MQQIDTPVLIVGAGPTGMLLSLLLQRLGVASRIVERREGPQRAPAAHAINARTFEICRQAGVDMAAIDAASIDPRDGGAVHWVTRLGGEVLGSLPYERQRDDAALASSPTPLRNLSQHRFEPILLDALRAAGAGEPGWQQRWTSATEDADGVTSVIADGASGATCAVRSRFLVGADGAGSPVRKWTGIAQEGPEQLQSFVMIHLAADLRPLVADRPGVLFFVCDPGCGGVFVAHDIDREWVFMHAFDPASEPASSYDAERCLAIARRAMARDDMPLEVRTVSTWHMTCQVAERYREGRVLLAGDAAHRFPPTGGLGLNTGAADAHNLAWKLAAVLRGGAPEALLDTYQQERRPVARYNAEQSLANAMRLLEIPQALGVSTDAAESRRAYAQVLADPARRAALGEAIAHQAEHFDMLGLQLGYAYDEGALVRDGEPVAAVENTVRAYVPSSRAGARLPHGWVRGAGGRCSTLDLIGLDGPTLLVGPDGGAWRDAAREVDAGLRCVALGDDVADPDAWWTSVAGLPPDGALLVRPDQHVAFRSRGPAGDPVATLRCALAAVSCSAAARGAAA